MPSIRINISGEAFEGLSEMAARKGSTVETVAGSLVSNTVEQLWGPVASPEAVKDFGDTSKWGTDTLPHSSTCKARGGYTRVDVNGGQSIGYKCQDCLGVFDSPYSDQKPMPWKTIRAVRD